MRDEVFPGEKAYDALPGLERRPARRTPGARGAQDQGSARGLWNLFLPSESGLTQLEYATLAELTGWSLELAPEALNCAAPDTGNMELLHLLGTEEQKRAVARAVARRARSARRSR